MRITSSAFRFRLSIEERTAWEMAALDNPAADMADRAAAASLRTYLADVSVAPFIDLANVDERARLTTLETAGILAPGRALVILDAPLTEGEVWNG